MIPYPKVNSYPALSYGTTYGVTMNIASVRASCPCFINSHEHVWRPFFRQTATFKDRKGPRLRQVGWREQPRTTFLCMQCGREQERNFYKVINLDEQKDFIWIKDSSLPQKPITMISS